jgi:hypothetical protein
MQQTNFSMSKNAKSPNACRVFQVSNLRKVNFEGMLMMAVHDLFDSFSFPSQVFRHIAMLFSDITN